MARRPRLHEEPDLELRTGRATRRVWSNLAGDDVLEAISIADMAHGVPLGAVGNRCYGTASDFHFDVGISSTHHITSFWGIAGELPTPTEEAGFEVSHLTRAAPERAIPLEEHASASADADQRTSGSVHDPRIHITAAPKAAGLIGRPAVEGGPADPSRAIERTLRSVGLLKN